MIKLRHFATTPGYLVMGYVIGSLDLTITDGRYWGILLILLAVDLISYVTGAQAGMDAAKNLLNRRSQ